MSFPSVDIGSDYDRHEYAPGERPEAAERLSRRACLIVWGATAAMGWGMFALILHFVS